MGILAVKRVLIKFKIRVLLGRIQRKVVISCHVGIEESIALASNLVPFIPLSLMREKHGIFHRRRETEILLMCNQKDEEEMRMKGTFSYR